MTTDLMEKRLPPDDRRCTAKSKQSGERCKRRAIPGGHVCIIHGGRTPGAVAAAQRQLVEQRARRSLADLHTTEAVVDPFAALESLAAQAVGLVDVLRGMVGDLEEIRYRGGPGSGTEQVRGEVQVYLSTLGRAEAILSKIIGLGIEGRKVQIEEAKILLIVSALDSVLAHRDLALDPDRQRRARELLARRLGAPELVSKPLAEPRNLPADLDRSDEHLIHSQASGTEAVER